MARNMYMCDTPGLDAAGLQSFVWWEVQKGMCLENAGFATYVQHPHFTHWDVSMGVYTRWSATLKGNADAVCSTDAAVSFESFFLCFDDFETQTLYVLQHPRFIRTSETRSFA